MNGPINHETSISVRALRTLGINMSSLLERNEMKQHFLLDKMNVAVSGFADIYDRKMLFRNNQE